MSKVNFSSTVEKAITYILVVLLVLGVAGVIVYLLVKDEGVTFSVEYGSERYFSGVTEADLTLYTGETHEFSVKSLTGGEVDYSVRVTSNREKNFRFTVGTEMYRLYNDNAELDDYSDMFGLEVSSTGFSLTIPQDMDVENVLEQRYGGSIDILFDAGSYVIAVSGVSLNQSSIIV